MKILIACERSGIVREAFRARGHDAWSCDLQDTDLPGQHVVGDVRALLHSSWDMMIAHPPCTYISYAGARWWRTEGYAEKQAMALEFFRELLNAPIPMIAVENPRGVAAQLIRKPDDVIEPYQFGEPYKKRTYLWLKNLPPLISTMRMMSYQVNWTEAQTRDRQNTRSKTFRGVASAMAQQWA